MVLDVILDSKAWAPIEEIGDSGEGLSLVGGGHVGVDEKGAGHIV